jgi:hypothetical protein
MCVLIIEDSYLVRQVDAENGCYVQRREARESGESQCAEKLFLNEARGPGGGTPKNQKSKIQKSKIAKLKKSKSSTLRFF